METRVKQAIELQPGDVLTGSGEHPKSLYAGTVKSTVVVDRGVQINLAPSGFFVRPETYSVEVQA